MSSVSSSADLVESFRAAQREHDALRAEHTATKRALAGCESDLAERAAALAHARSAEARAREEAASLRATLCEYVGAFALRAEPADAFTPSEREQAARREAAADERERALETRNAASQAEVQALRARLADDEAVHASASELAADRNRERARAREAEHRAREQEALVAEHVKRAAHQREASGKTEMDYQRRVSHMQEQLSALTKRLRAEKTLKEQSQARAQELSFHVAAGPTGGVAEPPLLHGRSMFRPAPAHASAVFAARRPAAGGY
jgi:hypothetical protein